MSDKSVYALMEIPQRFQVFFPKTDAFFRQSEVAIAKKLAVNGL